MSDNGEILLDEFANLVLEMVEACDRKGLTRPFIVTLTDRNGATFRYRCGSGNQEWEVLEDPGEAVCLAPPYAVTVEDANGDQVQSVIIKDPSPPTFH